MEVDVKIKRYMADSMRAALDQVRIEQGPDAVILSSRRVNEGIEVIAAVDYDEALIAGAARQYSQALAAAAAPLEVAPLPVAVAPAVAPSRPAALASKAQPPSGATAMRGPDGGAARGMPVATGSAMPGSAAPVSVAPDET